MAMKALRCPQCGAELELDDSKEFGFCSSCGTKIMLNEKVEVKHSGDVHMKVDNSDQGHNRIALGNRAFDGGNFEEAYQYYTQGLEDVPNDFYALYRKGLCAIALSPEDDLRLGEFISGAEAALAVLSDMTGDADEETEEAAEMADEFDTDLSMFGFAVLEKSDQYIKSASSIDECHAQAALWCETAKFTDLVTEFLLGEEEAEKLLEAAIDRCDADLLHERAGHVSYYSHTTTNKKGKSTDHYTTYHMSQARLSALQEARDSMAERYNNLPSRVERGQGLANDLETLQKESEDLKGAADKAGDAYKTAKENFWSAHPEFAARRDKTQNLTWISVGVGGLIFIVTLFFASNTIIAPIIGIAALVGSVFLKKVLSQKLLEKLENELFPGDVKALGETFDKAFAQWREKEMEIRNKNGEISAFENSKL